MKKVWQTILAIGSALGALALLFLAGKKSPVVSQGTAAKIVAVDDRLVSKIEEIQSKTQEEVLKEASPAVKEEIKTVVETQVDSAMKDAQKYKRKKSS